MHFVFGWMVHNSNPDIILYHDRLILLVNLFLQEGSRLAAAFAPRPVMIFPLRKLRLPYAVLPNTAFAQADSHQGTLVVNIVVDKTPIWTGPDVGSKPWLLAHALGGVSSRQVSSDVNEANIDVRDSRSHEEDTPYREGDSLPEDRFHKADIISQHAIDTRQHQRREKVPHEL